jgi:hypothetical protein
LLDQAIENTGNGEMDQLLRPSTRGRMECRLWVSN